MLRTGIVGPLVRPRTIPSALGRNHKILGIRRQRFGNQFFADVRAVGVRGVYKVDAQLDGAAKNGDCCSGILGRPPNPITRNTHGSVSKTVNPEFTTERDGSAGSSWQTFY